jgi:hypothetical protein
VRILETVGRAMREMKSAPEKIVMLEVGIVRLVRPDLDSTYEALDERLTRLERDGARAPAAAAPTPPAPVLRPIGSTPSSPSAVVEPAPEPALDVVAEPSAAEVDEPSAPEGSDLALDDVRERFVQRVIPRTSRSAQLLLKAAHLRSLEGTRLTIALPSEEMRQNTELIAQGLRSAMEHEFKGPLQILWTVDPALATQTPAPSQRPPARRAVPDEPVSTEETSVVVESAAGHLITTIFPGAEEI